MPTRWHFLSLGECVKWHTKQWLQRQYFKIMIGVDADVGGDGQ
jgi:hypothetical protein